MRLAQRVKDFDPQRIGTPELHKKEGTSHGDLLGEGEGLRLRRLARRQFLRVGGSAARDREGS